VPYCPWRNQPWDQGKAKQILFLWERDEIDSVGTGRSDFHSRALSRQYSEECVAERQGSSTWWGQAGRVGRQATSQRLWQNDIVDISVIQAESSSSTKRNDFITTRPCPARPARHVPLLGTPTAAHPASLPLLWQSATARPRITRRDCGVGVR